jgi:hypothetical protein
VIPKWDESYIHVFKNGDYFNGICIFSKSSIVSNKEFNYRFFSNNKELDILASKPKPYDKFYISTYEEYLEAKNKSSTNMFWIIPNDVIIDRNFTFDYRVSAWNEQYIHAFLNNKHYDGIALFSKSLNVSPKEFKNRFYLSVKKIEINASKPKPYDKFYISTYEEYLEAKSKSSTDMFWVIWNNITIVDQSIFNLYFSHYETYDRNENHIFKNSCNGVESYYNGVVLFSKNKLISKRELENKFLIERKEHACVVSKNVYQKHTLTSYDQYLEIIKIETLPLFWGVWPEIEVIDVSVFDLYFDPRDGKYDHDRKENHVFKHRFRNDETYTNGIVLFSKNKKITKKEFEFRHLIEKKEYDITVSKMKPYDIVFISYNEVNADENYKNLLDRFPNAVRVHGVKGIHQAHIEAARRASTEMFWVVDADAIIENDFNFDHEVSRYDLDVVHVWKSQNPINNLVYGYGGVKLFPREMTINMDITKTDMTTSISSKFKSMPEISNITAFNVDPFNTWKSAFRECVKLASRTIVGQQDLETQERLEIWKTSGKDKLFGEYAIQGAIDGENYGLKYKNNPEFLRCINDFEWLNQYWKNINE